MKKTVLYAVMLCGLPITTPLTTANDKVEQIYNPDLYMKACKGKSQGDAVTFAHRGILWNGTCQPQFFADTKESVIGNESAIYTTCSSTTGTTTAMINGMSLKGKCALGFTPPQPR